MDETGISDVSIELGSVTLPGLLGIPANACGVVLFSHGSGSSRLSPRNSFVARQIRQAGIATLLFDLLTPEEDADYERRFDIPFLTQRLVQTTQWLDKQPIINALPIGYFGASTGSASALYAAAELGGKIHTIVSRGGRPDLALDILSTITAPTLLIVGGSDEPVLSMNREAYEKLAGIKELAIVPNATHLFEEAGALEEVAHLAVEWFRRYLCHSK